MLNLIRRWRGERGESYGLSLDGSEISAVAVRGLSGGRYKIELADKTRRNFWLTARKDLAFLIRHTRIPENFKGPVYKYVSYDAEEIFRMKGEPLVVRTDEIQDPDGVLFVHGVKEKRHRDLLKDYYQAGVDPNKADGLVPPAVALCRAVELLEDRPFTRFLVVLHLGHTGAELVGIRDGRPVFYRDIYRPAPNMEFRDPSSATPSGSPALPGAVLKHPSSKMMADDEAGHLDESQLPLLPKIADTIRYMEKNPHFGKPDEVVLTGPWANDPERLEEVLSFFPKKSNVRLLTVSDKILSESLTVDDLRTHTLAVGAAGVGLRKSYGQKINFLADPKFSGTESRDSVYDKIILGCVAAMLALAFVTANAFFLDLTKSRLSKIAENQKTIESLRAKLMALEPDLESATRFLNAAGVRFDSFRSKTFSIPASVAKLLSAIESAAPEGVTMDKIESGSTAGAAQGRYSNFFSQGEPVSIVLSGRAQMPEHVIFFQDALRNELGVSVDIASMGREGDVWSRKPVNFVIVLRGSIRRA